MQTQCNHCRFIVLGAARTGSNYLMSLLGVHEKVKAYGELFNLDMLFPAQLKEVLDDPIAHLQKKLNRELPVGKAAVGFKLFYDHLSEDYFQKVVDREETTGVIRDRIDRLNTFIDAHYSRKELYEQFKKTWEYMIGETGIKIIHLKRKNKLRSLLSLKTAYQNNEWMNYTGKPGEKVLIEVTYEECCRYFSRLEEYENTYSGLFAAHETLELSYEELVDGKERSLDRAIDFLQLPRAALFTRLHKQNGYEPEEVIAGYAGLKDRFDTTRWKTFFS